MKRCMFILAAGIAAIVLISGCSSSPKVERVGADTLVDLSGDWNDTDVREVCDTLLAQAFESPRIDSYIKDYAAKNQGRIPTVIVGRFKNSSSEHINTAIISRIMRTAIINSGKLEFVEGGNAREELRAERNDQQVNADEASAAQLANETGANFMLQGEVNSLVDRAGNRTVRSYFVSASITNVETNNILWEGENNNIKKVITQPKAKF